MTYIKLLTALTALALLTACGGATPTAKGDSSQTTDCAANPFGASCIAEDINVEARITDCITAGNAGDTKCASLTSDTAMNTAINTCLTNPFDESCTASDFTFSTYAEMARVNRVSFCETAGNETDALCPTLVRTCIANPFGATCGAYFESAKASYCMTNDVVACPNATYADWLASPAGTGLATAPVSTHTANQFLSGLTATLPTFPSDFTLGNGTRATSLTLADNGFGGDAVDGASFFFGNFFNQGNRYYAGIHASTDLGAPLDNISQAGIWIGWLRLDGSFRQNRRFDLTVTFNTASQGGTIATSFITGGLYISIDGAFNDKGVITTGNFIFGTSDDGLTIADNDERTPGTLTGLIGQEGAVGAFYSTTNTRTPDGGQNPYSGAFVALPPPPPDPCVKAETCVDTADWLASFTGNDALPTTPDATTRVNQFLQATTTGFNTGANTGIREFFGNPQTDIAIQTLTFAEADTATGGVAFFGGEHYNNGVRVPDIFFHYAGVLAGTSVGAPITAPITSARWEGEIRVLAPDTFAELSAGEITDFGVDITFDGTEGEITSYFTTDSNTFYYSIDGKFDANGIITGDVAYANGTASGLNTDSQVYSPGTLTGIIGQNGAVGAFISGHKTLTAGSVGPSFSGGFVVTPPAN